ncbi:MAG: hypothetical protein ABW203_07660 [Novosphingobium sp.]
MIAQRNLHRLGWAVALMVACALLLGLSLRVNALKSQVRRAELAILSVKHEKLYLETEFETRSNQQQLESWNDVDFGYVAPGPGQFLSDTHELAALGRQAAPPAATDPAPAPVRMAAATIAAPAALAPAVAARRSQPPVVLVAVNDAAPRSIAGGAQGDDQ